MKLTLLQINVNGTFRHSGWVLKEAMSPAGNRKCLYCEKFKDLHFLSSLSGTAGAQICRQYLCWKCLYCEKVQGFVGHCWGTNMQARDWRRLIFMAMVEVTRDVFVPEVDLTQI